MGLYKSITLSILLTLSLAASIWQDLHAQTFRNEWIDYSKTYYKFAIRETKVYRIPYSTLQTAGLSATPGSSFKLISQGEEVPLYITSGDQPLQAADYIEFYGKKNDGRLDTEMFEKPEYQAINYVSLISDSTFFYLTVSPETQNKRLLPADNNVATTTLPADSFFMYTYEYFFGTGWYNLGGGEYVSTTNNSTTGFSIVRSSNYTEGEGFTTQPIYNGNEQTIAITGMQYFANADIKNFLLSYKTSGAFRNLNPRSVELVINDSLSSILSVPDYTLKTRINEPIPVSRIINDRLNIRFQLDNKYWQEAVYMNQLSVTYPRKFNFGGNRLFGFTLPASVNGYNLRIAAFRHENQRPILYDFSNLRRYLGVLKQDSVLLLLPPATTSRELVLATNNTTLVTTVPEIKPVQFRDFSQTENIGDFTIIASKALFGDASGNAIDEYAEYRKSAAGGSHNVMIVDMDEISDQFGYGIRKHPVGLRNFLLYAGKVKNRENDHFMLIGRSMFPWSYRLYQPAEIARFNSIPTWGIPGSETLLSAKDINAPYPSLNLGRLPAMNALEVRNYLEKVQEYEYNLYIEKRPEERVWQKKAAFLVGTDDQSRSGILQKDLDSIRQRHDQGQWQTRNSQSNRKLDKNYQNNFLEIQKAQHEGIGMIFFLGESFASSIDFGIDRFESYEISNGKYPLFFAMGCYLGGFNDRTVPPGYFWPRAYRYDIDFGEHMLFAKKSGSIALITNTDVGLPNYVRADFLDLMKFLGQDNYGKSLSEVMRSTKAYRWETFPTKWDQRFIHEMQTFTYFGDPAIIAFNKTKPDVAFGSSNTSRPFKARRSGRDSIQVKIPIYNIGTDIGGSRMVKVKSSLIMPWGDKKKVGETIVYNLIDEDSVMVNISYPEVYNQDTIYLEVAADPDGLIDELDKENNVLKYAVLVPPPGLSPVYPMPMSIVTSAPTLLKASTFNGLAPIRSYRMQVDTTNLFNSPILVEKTVSAKGGIVEFPTNDISWKNGTVYYWRTATISNSMPEEWHAASFRYEQAASEGFGQSHWHQWLDSLNLVHGRVDTLLRYIDFPDSLHTIYTDHGVWQSSAWQDSHQTIQLDGKSISFSACVGRSLIFNVFDPVTMQPIQNSGGFMGSGGICREGAKYNFEFSYYPASNRQKISAFMNWIPKESYVMVRMILDPPHDSSYTKYWAKDTLLYGNNSMYALLKQQGFYTIDSLNRAGTFAFMYKKDDSTHFRPKAVLSEGLYDRVQHTFFTGSYTKKLLIKSPEVGPATHWNTATWNITTRNGEPVKLVKVTVVGHQPIGEFDLLRSSNNASGTFSLTDISATEFPKMHLEFEVDADERFNPAQLKDWRIDYIPAGDVAINTNQYLEWSGDTLYHMLAKPHLAFPIVNTGLSTINPVTYDIKMVHENGIPQIVRSGTLKTIAPGDTAMIRYDADDFPPLGKSYIQVMINEQQLPIEKFGLNGFGFREYTVLPNQFQLLQFDAIANGNDIAVSWQVTHEGPVAYYELEYGRTPAEMQVIYKANKQTVNADATYNYNHPGRNGGYHYYRLRIINVAGEVSYSDVRKVWVGKVQPVTVYPVPTRDFFNIVPYNDDNSWQALIFDAAGKLIYNATGSGVKRIDARGFAAGHYFLKWSSGDESVVIPVQKL